MSEEAPSILLCGVLSEPPLEMVAKALDCRGTPYIAVSQRDFGECQIQFMLTQGLAVGTLTVGDVRVQLEQINAVYTRMTDWQTLPEVVGAEGNDAVRTQCQLFHDAFQRWVDVMPGLVVNPMRAMASNAAKPYQAQIIRKYFHTPDTLITNDPGAVLDFLEVYPRSIYKSISGARSIVTEVTEDDLDRLSELRHCPTMFQACVDGIDVRVHTVGSRVFATAVESGSTDYRYGHWDGDPQPRLSAVELPPDVEAACVQLAKDLELPFAGIDLRITEEDEVYCFEANPSPAYSYYEVETGQPIAEAVADLLDSPAKRTG